MIKMPDLLDENKLTKVDKLEKLLPELLDEYQQGKICLKKIMQLTGIDADRLLAKIVELDIECPISPENDDYTTHVTEELMKKIKM
jgi:hypothetical protein